MPASKGDLLMDADAMQQALSRITHEILERNGESSLDRLAIVGIRTRGVPLARRISELLERFTGQSMPVGLLDINLYRDDLSRIADHPVLRRTEIPFDVDGARIVLVDDVLFTGRTIRAALEGLMDLGRPDWIQLAVLVDRGHREVPIRADFVGMSVPTRRDQLVEVRLGDVDDGREEVELLELPAPPQPASPAPASRRKKKAGKKKAGKKKTAKKAARKKKGRA